MSQKSRANIPAQFLTNILTRGLILTALTFPYQTRGHLIGWVFANLISPIFGYRERTKKHVSQLFPKLSRQKQRKIVTDSLYNAGRTIIENYSTTDLLSHQKYAPVHGKGLTALTEATKNKRPVLLISGHFGNYEAARAALINRGFNIGGLYRNMSNPYFNSHYVQTIKALGPPVFAQTKIGLTGFVRHLKSGGPLVVLNDQHVEKGPILEFLGLPARTSTSVAKLALRYNALLIPFYGIRQTDGINFDCILEAPIQHSDPNTMTQALNDSIGARILAHPEQWFWIARRWQV